MHRLAKHAHVTLMHPQQPTVPHNMKLKLQKQHFATLFPSAQYSQLWRPLTLVVCVAEKSMVWRFLGSREMICRISSSNPISRMRSASSDHQARQVLEHKPLREQAKGERQLPELDWLKRYSSFTAHIAARHKQR